MAYNIEDIDVKLEFIKFLRFAAMHNSYIDIDTFEVLPRPTTGLTKEQQIELHIRQMESFNSFFERESKLYSIPEINFNSLKLNTNANRISGYFEDKHSRHLFTSELQRTEIIKDIRIVNNLILDKLKHKPSEIHKLTPHEFEQFAAELLEKNGYEVKLTQQTRDGGKDIVVIKKGLVGTFLTYVECKKFAPDNHVGVKLIRELYGTIIHDRATSGMFITSSYFSRDAYEFTETIKYQMELVDFNNLSEMLIKI